jgi:hypothetical protein
MQGSNERRLLGRGNVTTGLRRMGICQTEVIGEHSRQGVEPPFLRDKSLGVFGTCELFGVTKTQQKERPNGEPRLMKTRSWKEILECDQGL